MDALALVGVPREARGVYLLDRGRELYLLDYAALKGVRSLQGAPAPPGGSLFAGERWVCALGAASLWIFEARE